MARPRTEKIGLLKSKLIARLNDGFHRPGDRFLSNRALAQRYGISYQTAHRLVTELRSEGYLERRPASGTYIAGTRPRQKGAELWFHPRARRPGSFGAHLLGCLEAALREAGVACAIRWAEAKANLSAHSYPVLWEAPALLAQAVAAHRYVLVLNDRPTPGLEASLIDAIATDDFSAGVCAAQVFQQRLAGGSRFAVVAGPADDKRSRSRVEGFLSRLPKSRVISARGWYLEDGAQVAPRALAAGPDGIFCVNDRLAEAIIAHCGERGLTPPPIIGHDNAPVAENLHLSTIAIAWDEMNAAAVKVIRSRLAGDSGIARQIILAQRPVYRLTA